MSTLSDLVTAHGVHDAADIEWLHRLAGDGQLLADLAFADIVIWVPTEDESFIAVAHTRPSSAATLFYRDIVGDRVRPQWRTQIRDAFAEARIVDSASPDWFEETPTRVRAVPIVRGTTAAGAAPRVIGVLTRHTNLGEARTPSRQQITFNDCADDLFGMVAWGEFPDLSAPTSPRRGAPRAPDGLIRIDVDGVTTFASPNALSAFNRMGFDDELEGESLVEVVTQILPAKRQFDESLPVVVTGRAPWRTDIEARGVTVSLRAIPLRDHGVRIGAIVLCRDVTEMRHQEQELITKDATIREIHHRVKNNLQTIQSLLRLQARRLSAAEGRDAVEQSARRIGSIALVHETLSSQVADVVDFDDVVGRIVRMVEEGLGGPERPLRVAMKGTIGELPGDMAMPLSVAVTELVQNAIDHAAPQSADVTIELNAEPRVLSIRVVNGGDGVSDGFSLDHDAGLGLTIVRTFIVHDLGGTISIGPAQVAVPRGTAVEIRVPRRVESLPLG